jgi:hypothetical protein
LRPSNIVLNRTGCLRNPDGRIAYAVRPFF